MNHLKEILLTLSNNKVDFIIGGGVAAVLHGVERVTMDLDLAVSRRADNFKKFLDCMRQLNMRPSAPVSVEEMLVPGALERIVQEKHAVVFSFVDYDQPMKHIDLFLRPDLSFEALQPHSEWVSLERFKVRVITKQHLLDIKRAITPPRLKDQMDIEVLQELIVYEAKFKPSTDH